MKKYIVQAMLVAALASVTPAHAIQFLFSGDEGLVNTLRITTASETLDFLTSQSQFTPGSLNQGWWSATSANIDANDNFFVGDLGGIAMLNHFFTFDLSSFGGGAISATLIINTLNTSTGDLPVSYTLWDVTTPADELNFTDGFSPAIYEDLLSGRAYAGVLVNSVPSPTWSIELNANAIADINAAAGVGFFSVGGTLTPEPGTLGLLAGGLIAVACGIRRNRKRA